MSTSFFLPAPENRLPRSGWFAAFSLALLCLALWLQPAPVHARQTPADAQAPHVAAASLEAGRGYVDKAQLRGDVLTIEGWAAAGNPSVFVTLVEIWLGEQSIYRGRLGYLTNRSDVVEATGQPLWLSSGFHLPVRIPGDMAAGDHPLRVRVTNGDGSQFDLALSGEAARVHVAADERRPSLKSRIALALAFVLPLGCLLLFLMRRDASSGAGMFAASVAASFALLVAAGWSGSSLPLLLDRAGVLEHDAAPFIGQAREVRRDEWLIVTPLAMSQRAQAAPFAAVNTLQGVYGQNMNVVGMTGAPTLGLAELARPAGWGFLAFDLRRALAWYWWFPFFACYLALWALLRCWFGIDWRHAAVLAVLAPGSAYSVGWSGWPAYVSFFPVLAALAAVRIFAASRASSALSWGLALGWAAAGFVLVLYPGWQIPLAYLMGLLTLAQLWNMRARLHWRWAQWLGLLVAAALAGLLLWSWWHDAREAIVALARTVYPGQRSMELGGYVEPWHLSKGLANLVMLYESSQWSIPSDAAGHIYLLIPLAVATLARLFLRRSMDAMVLVLWLFIAFVLAHMFVGIPEWLGRASLWGKAPAFRLDVALGLAQVFLLACFLKESQALQAWQTGSMARTRGMQWLAGVAAAGFAWFHWRSLGMMPVPMQDWLNPALLALVLAAGAWLAYLLVRGQVWPCVAACAVWTLAVSLPFNPLWQAPAHVSLVPELQQALHAPVANVGADAGKGSHMPLVAVVSEDLWVSALPISGVRVVNGFFYDPPLRFWRGLDPQGRLDPIYNRYQFMQIKLREDLADADFEIRSPRMDSVILDVQPERFDFNKVQADFVLANPQDARLLAANPRLELQKTDGLRWALLRVLR